MLWVPVRVGAHGCVPEDRCGPPLWPNICILLSVTFLLLLLLLGVRPEPA